MAPGEAPDEQMSETLARMGAVLFSEQTLDAILQLIVSSAVEALSHAGAASVTLQSDGVPYTPNASSEQARAIDDAQYASGRGPCLTATQTGEFVSVVFEAGDERWPEFIDAAQRAGYAQSLSAPLFVEHKPVGALNVYMERDGVVPDREIVAMRLLGEHASIVLSNAVAFTRAGQLNAQLREALATRETIGQATGIIMARENLDAKAAFDVLRRASQRANRKLRDIGQEVVDSNARNRDGVI